MDPLGSFKLKTLLNTHHHTSLKTFLGEDRCTKSCLLFRLSSTVSALALASEIIFTPLCCIFPGIHCCQPGQKLKRFNNMLLINHLKNPCATISSHFVLIWKIKIVLGVAKQTVLKDCSELCIFQQT